jgi:hypothetical protein
MVSEMALSASAITLGIFSVLLGIHNPSVQYIIHILMRNDPSTVHYVRDVQGHFLCT